jgi:hypothetical protein
MIGKVNVTSENVPDANTVDPTLEDTELRIVCLALSNLGYGYDLEFDGSGWTIRHLATGRMIRFNKAGKRIA